MLAFFEDFLDCPQCPYTLEREIAQYRHGLRATVRTALVSRAIRQCGVVVVWLGERVE